MTEIELGGWDVVAAAVKPVLVEPVHPAEGGEFEFVDAVPALGVGNESATVPIEGLAPISSRRSVKRTDVNRLGATGRCNTSGVE